MSRCGTLNGVHVVGNNQESCFCDLGALNEYDRMRSTEPSPIRTLPNFLPQRQVESFANDPFFLQLQHNDEISSRWTTIRTMYQMMMYEHILDYLDLQHNVTLQYSGWDEGSVYLCM